MRERATESGRKGRDWYFWLGQSTLHRQHKISADAQALGEYLESHPACSSDVFEIQCPRKGSPSSKDHQRVARSSASPKQPTLFLQRIVCLLEDGNQ